MMSQDEPANTTCFRCVGMSGRAPEPDCTECGGTGHHTSHDWEIICPYCGLEDENTTEHRFDDGDSTEVDCPHCDATHHVQCKVTYTYDCRRLSTTTGAK